MDGKDENAVFVGRRTTMNNVMATMIILNKGEVITFKARGRAISHAVDVCEILRNRFLKGTEYVDIKLSTEQLEGENGQTNNVSSIEIILSRLKLFTLNAIVFMSPRTSAALRMKSLLKLKDSPVLFRSS